MTDGAHGRSSVAARLKVGPARIEVGSRRWSTRDWSRWRARAAGECEFTLTAEGHDDITRLQAARRPRLTELLDGWDPDAQPETGTWSDTWPQELRADDEKLLADAKVSVSHSVGAWKP